MIIKINGLSTHYQRIGQGKRMLVMLHGWGCDWQIFAPVVSQLSKQFTLIIPDLPCFGQSDCPTKAWSSFDYAQWLEQFVDQVVGPQKFSLLGHSFGGKVSAVFASTNQSKHMVQLILVDSAGLPDPLTPSQLVVKQMAQWLPFSVKKLVRASFKHQLFTKLGVGLDYLNSTPAQQQILKRIVRENIADQLIAIKIPTLLIWGRHDQATPIHQGEKFHQLIAGSQIKVLENSDHFPFICEPERFIQLIS